MLVGQDDGGVALLVSGAAGAWTLQRAMPGIGAVTALAFDDAALRALRGARGGVIDVLDLGSGAATAQLQGHTGDVTSMDADWSTGRAATASRDGSVRSGRERARGPAAGTQIDTNRPKIDRKTRPNSTVDRPTPIRLEIDPTMTQTRPQADRNRTQI